MLNGSNLFIKIIQKPEFRNLQIFIYESFIYFEKYYYYFDKFISIDRIFVV